MKLDFPKHANFSKKKEKNAKDCKILEFFPIFYISMSEHSYLDNISIEQNYSTFIKKEEILFGVDISQRLLKRLKILIKNESEESFHVVYVFCVKT